MTDQTLTVVLVHGAFAESSSWNGVVGRLRSNGLPVVAVANPLRSVTGDAAYLRDVVAAVGTRVLLVGHSYGGNVITEAADSAAVVGLVYVAAFAPDSGESALQLSGQFAGSTLGEAITAYPVATGGNEFAIRQESFRHQFAADVSSAEAAVMAVTQRPVTEVALSEGLPSADAAWRRLPSWFVFGDADLNIPPELHRFQAERSNSRGTHEVEGASHAISVSKPDHVAATILEAVDALR